MLARDGDKAVVKVLDFGLAKVTSEGQTDGALTHDGQMLGTPRFHRSRADPRRAVGRYPRRHLQPGLHALLPLDGRAAVPAGEPLRPSPGPLLDGRQAAEPGRPEVPVELAALVAKMMAKEPERRFQEPKDVAQALAPFFKKGNVALKSSGVELSQAGQTGSGRPVPDVVRTPTLAESYNGARLMARPKNGLDPPAPATEWKSLIDLSETDGSRHEAPASKPRRRPPWLRPPIAITALVFGLLLTLGAVLLIRTAKGTIELVGLPQGCRGLRRRRGSLRHLAGRRQAGSDHSRPGTRKIKVKMDQIETSGDEVTIRAWGKETLTVRILPLSESRLTKFAADDRRDRSDVPKADSARTDPGLAKKPDSPLIIAGNPDSKPRTAEEGKKKPEPKNEIPTSVVGQDLITTQIGQIRLKWIPDGKFMMGSSGPDEERPQREVRITRSFYLGIYEVTQGQHLAVMGQNPSQFRGSDNLPVERVSWLDAVTFCNKLSEREGREPFFASQGPWLPSLAETAIDYPRKPNGNMPAVQDRKQPSPLATIEDRLVSYAWMDWNSEDKTHPVGTLQANAFGLFDIHGNVYEWCWDRYSAEYYQQSPEVDPHGPSQGESRVFRGGSWGPSPTSSGPRRGTRAAPELPAR